MGNKEYKVEIESNDYITFLKVTHTGYQWTTIRIDNPEYEIPKIIEVLQNYLNDTRQDR